MSNTIITLFLIFFFLEWMFHSYLEILNIKHLKLKKGQIPEILQGKLDPDQQSKAEDYTLVKSKFGLFQNSYSHLFTLVLLFSGILPWVNEMAAGMISGYHQGVLFLIILSVFSFLVTLPFSLYSTFGIEKRFGFNTMTPGLWLKDLVKGTALGAVIGIPLLYAVFWFMDKTGAFWWIWITAFLFIVQMVMIVVYPRFIAPLFNKFSPLENQDLARDIEELAQKTGFTSAGIFQMDGSKRSKHSNAYFTGFGKTKRIVLFDTLLEIITPGETLAVLAHELGHFKLNHIKKMLVMNLLQTVFSFWVLSLLIDWQPLYNAFGFSEPQIHTGLFLFMIGSGYFTFFLSPLSSIMSRKHEYEADAFSVNITGKPEDLKNALVILNKENLSNLHPHPFYSAWHYSHPTLLERLTAVDKLASANSSEVP